MSPQMSTLVYADHGKNVQPALQIHEFCTHEAKEYGKSRPVTMHSLNNKVQTLPDSRPVGLPTTRGEFSLQVCVYGFYADALTVTSAFCVDRGEWKRLHGHTPCQVSTLTLALSQK